jgi:hypothetical protein
MADPIEWRITTFFAYWRRRLEFIRALDPHHQVHEANILVWAALDALANLWANGMGKTLVAHPSKQREAFDAFLVHYGGEPFGRVSLPDIWHRVDTAKQPQLAAGLWSFLKTAGGRRRPTVLERQRMREVSEDPEFASLVREALASRPGADQAALENWLSLSRYGSIAYKRMRSAYIHEGRPGKHTHSFHFHDSAKAPTYLSGVFGTPAILGFKPEFMVTVLERCITAFEAEALATKTDPVIP